jgi:hypothetical protein
METPSIITTRAEMDQLHELQGRWKSSRAASFSTNKKGELWYWAVFGPTEPEHRVEVRGKSALLDKIQLVYLSLKDKEFGGRFFVDGYHAFYKDLKSSAEICFLLIEITDEALPTPEITQSDQESTA